MPVSNPLRALRPLVWTLLFPVLLGSSAAMGETPPEQGPAPGTYEELADILEDDQRRQRLVEVLRRLAAAGEAAGPAEPAAAEAAAGPSLPERIAAATGEAATGLVNQLDRAVDAIAALARGPGPDWGAVGVAAGELAGLIVATVVVFVALRRLARPLFARAGAWGGRGEGGTGLLRRAIAVVVAAAIDGASVALAWLAGWALAVFAIGEPGAIEPRLSLFLNAFVAIEGLKAVVRVVFAPRADELRLLPIAAVDAAYWNAWLAHLASFVGYGALVAVPIVSAQVAPALGRIVYVLVVGLGFVYALAIILQNRARVRARLEAVSQRAPLATARVSAAVLARVWHLAALAYLAALAVALLTRPQAVLPFMAVATVQSLVALGLGVLLGAVVGRAIGRGIRLPAATAAQFPTLEARLNAFVPRGLQALRLVIGVLVAAVVLDAWQLFDLSAWLTSDTGKAVVSAVVSVAVILALAAAAWIVTASWIDHWLSEETGAGEPSARQRTLLTLFRNAAAVVIVTMAAMITLSQLGIDIGPLIAGAGVLGLAIGFGAQKLVQDIIGGVFIQLENAINTGDWVDAGGISGTAERLSIRSVGLRDLAGTFHVVPFSSVTTVSNYNRDFAYHVGHYGVAYREDTDEVVKHLIAAFEDLRQDAEVAQYIIGDLTVDGVSALADSSVNLRVRIMTTAGYQWLVGRAYNRAVKRHFDAAGIEIPFPHRTLYFGRDKDGSAPAANVHIGHAPDESAPAGA